MWSDEITNNLAKELEKQLDNKEFFSAKDYYSNFKNEKKSQNQPISKSNLAYAKSILSSESCDFNNMVKGISFSNKVEVPQKQNSIDDLSLEKRKIYRISDLLLANLAETIVIPYNVQPTSLALIKKFEWKDVLFSDVSTAWKMIKNKFNW